MRIFTIDFNHKRLYAIGLIFLAVSLPLSKFAISVSTIWLLSNWVLELDFKRKWETLKSSKEILIFSLIFFVHIMWLINTNNFSYAFKDIGNKVILLVFPLIIGTSNKLEINKIKKIIIWFTLAVVASTLISTGILIQIIDYPIQNIRDISPFMSHIRLSLLVNMSIFSLSYIFFSRRFEKSGFEKVIYPIIIVWLGIFLFLLKSFTGIIILFILTFIILGYVSFKIKEIVPKLFLQVSIITIFLLIASFLTHSVSKFYTKEIVDIDNIDQITINGNKYIHYFNNLQIENGNYVWLYICNEELEKEWNKKSHLDYNNAKINGQKLKFTLIRYLTSKGFRKDSIGISKLTSKDIANIESGMANYIFEDKYALYPKIYQAIWEIDVYNKGNNPTGNSITQRFEYMKAALGIIKANFWFGVGTGDVKDEFLKQYEQTNSKLSLKKRLRAHNQYITFLLTFGIFGFIIVLISIFYPFIKHKGYNNYFLMVFLIIALLSFVNEDTLETQIGVTFFSYFYSLFLFGTKMKIKRGKNYV